VTPAPLPSPAILAKMISNFAQLTAIVLSAIVLAVLAGTFADRTHLFHPHKELYLAFVFAVGIASGLGLLWLWPLKLSPDRPSEFKVGDHVAVRLNDRNRTPHVGEVREVIWHFKDARYNYYLSEGGKKVHKRYFAEDLERFAADEES
jgi:hypothetical protein